jgi:ABC-type phosphonate transport system ATPase subunit
MARRRGPEDARSWTELAPASEPHSIRHSVRLVVVEDGTTGLEEQAPPDGGEQTVVVAQSGGERPMDLAKRAIRRILALEQKQQNVLRTVLLLSPRFDAEATAARVSLARALMAHAATIAEGAPRLLLSAGSDLHADLQSKVLALRDALTGDPSGGALAVTVQFTQDGQAPVAQTD